MDRLPNDAMKIKVFSMIHLDENNSGLRCACVRGVSLRMFSAGRISLRLTGCSVCVGGLVDCSDRPRTDCVVDFSPGEVRIGYIRPGLWTDSFSATWGGVSKNWKRCVPQLNSVRVDRVWPM